MSCGVYCIRNKINSKSYIGSSVNIESRFCCHRSHLRGGVHGNEHLQNAWNLYKEESFEFLILELCEEKDLGIKEKYYCESLSCYCGGNGYNIAEVTEDRSFKIPKESYIKAVSTRRKNGRYVLSEETRRKISEGNKGRTAPFKGRTHTEEAKLKLSKKATGRRMREDTRVKISNKLKGREFSKETRAKMAEKSGLYLKASKVICQYCGKVNNFLNYNKYHGEKCKLKV